MDWNSGFSNFNTNMRSKRGMMLLQVHYKTHWEQHNRQSSFLASTTYQTLDKTCHRIIDLWSSHRCDSQPFWSDRGECSAAAANDRPASADQTTSANQSRPLPVRSSCPPYQILEAIHAYRSTGHSPPLASRIVLYILAAEVAGPAKDFGRNHCADPKDGGGESLVGSGTDPWGTIEIGDGSE